MNTKIIQLTNQKQLQDTNNIMNKNSILGYRQEEKWIKAPLDLNLSRPFVRSKLVKTLGNDQVQYQAQTEKGKICLKVSINQTYDVCKQQNTFDDMCQMSVLNEPEVLNNLVQRYLKDQIFTYIGPTLLVINPYRIIPQFFSQEVMLSLKEQIIKNNVNKQKPHVYYIAGQAYNQMIKTNKKQAIVISGQSGAGKTQSTKYCMQILTSLSHRKTHSIEAKILACNPLLEAFGNSKTVRNDNSSRFGKYVQIFFGHDYTIKGANISSYLLQKTRVVSIAKNQRSFHAFYALLASDKNKFKEPSAYKYLRQSECFQADNINQKQLYIEIIKSMDQIGFTQEQQNKIWSLVYVILQLGNIQFDDKNHQSDESQKCQITNKNYLVQISKNLDVKQIHLEQILLLEKKKFLKQYTFKPYNKQACYSNLNTLSKGIYNSIFQFILYKVQQSLRPKQQMNFKSINILDIFGFQNFQNNNFQQLCINFTNEKLLKLYNTYIFSSQMELLLQDGLNKEVSDIIPPTNDNIINVMTGQLSLFSIINDYTTPQQFNDKDMIQAFESKLKNTSVIKFDKLNKHFFNVLHSQCEVRYNIKGFKNKNQDKIIIEIQDIVTRLFDHENKEQKGKTLLNKFCKQIQDLMGQLNSSTVHFIRCIKPNDNKLPKSPNFHYIMTQIRYLGVFQTIQIRKKTFPSRKSYADFVNQYSILYPNISKINDKDTTLAILKNINCSPKDYMMGNHRIYVNTETQDFLGKKNYEMMKIHGAKAEKIQRAFRKYRFKKTILKKLKILVRRIHLWKKIVEKQRLKLIRKTYQLIKIIAKQRKIKQQQEKRKKLINEKQKKDEIKKQNLKKLHQKIILFSEMINNIIKKDPFKRIKKIQIKTQINSEKVNTMLNQTVMVDDSVINNESPYQKIEQTNQKQETQYKFNQSFLDEKSFYIPPSQNVIFKGNIRVNSFIKDKNDQDLCKLQKILMQEYVLKVPEKDQEYFSPISKDCNFKLEDTPPEMMNKVISFPLQNFFNQVLRKRTTFLGLRKGYMEILVAKPRPLTSSLTILNEADEQLALKIFKVLVRISEQNKLQNVFKLVDNLVVSCQGSSQSLKNQVFLQLIKQTNTNLDLASIRIYECMSVFLHIYNPENDYILAAMSLFYQKLAEGKIAPKEDDYLRYIFKKLIRKLKEAPSIGYMPIKYQLMALMCKRQISIPVYLPIGSSILIRVQSYETFGNIKQKVLKQFGIDHLRLKPQLFTFFEIVNFQNQQLEQSPIKENEAIWDIMTYWQLAKNKYQETGIVPPSFFLMLKIKYSYQCNKDDVQTIELFFAQTYFDYLIGRVRLPKQQMTQLAACVRLYKIHKESSDIISAYPVWIIKQIPQQTLRIMLTENIKTLESMNYSPLGLKYLFLEICSQYSLTMSMAIPTDQQIKMYLRPKNIYFTKNSQIEQSFPIKSIIKWAIDDQKFTFQSKSKKKNQEINKIVVMTQFASICSQYLNGISKLLTVNGQNKMQIS